MAALAGSPTESPETMAPEYHRVLPHEFVSQRVPLDGIVGRVSRTPFVGGPRGVWRMAESHGPEAASRWLKGGEEKRDDQLFADTA